MTGLRFASLACLAIAAVAPARAVVLVPVVPVAGSSTTTAFAVNDDDVIAGSYIDGDGREHAFFGTLDGNYTTFDAGSGGTEARGINDNGHITGFSNSQSGDAGAQPIFERKPDGKILGVTRSGEQLFGFAYGINNSQNRFAGAYWDPLKHQTVAFAGQKGAWRYDVKISSVHQASSARGINGGDVVIGSFFMPPMHGFVLSHKVLTVVDCPDRHAVATELEAINDNGQAVGQWTDAKGRAHSFLLDVATSSFADIEVKGASDVRAWGINTAGAVVLSSDQGAFVWCAQKSACPAGAQARARAK